MRESVIRKNLNSSPVHGEKKGISFLSVLFAVFVFFTIWFLLFLSFIGVCYIQQDSMESNYYNDDFVMVFKRPFSVTRGDVVILEGKNRVPENKDVIKRIIATGGDTIVFREKNESESFLDEHGRPYRIVLLFRKNNGSDEFNEVEESYIKEPMRFYYNDRDSVFYDKPDNECRIDNLITIKDGNLFVMGDNRNVSMDSRSPQVSPFPRSAVLGKVFARLTPNSGLEKFMLWLFRAKRPA
jgi:signal peptidase I